MYLNDLSLFGNQIFLVLCNRWDSFFIENVCENIEIQKYYTSESILFSILISLKMLKNNVWSYRAMPKHNTLNSSPLSNVEAVKKRKYIIIFHSTLVLLSQITPCYTFFVKWKLTSECLPFRLLKFFHLFNKVMNWLSAQLFWKCYTEFRKSL